MSTLYLIMPLALAGAAAAELLAVRRPPHAVPRRR